MKKFLLILIAFYATITSSAQVGIGNVPNPNSILDLTNSSEKWLILPKPTADPSGNALFLNTEASLFYYNSKLYFSDGSGSGGLNTLTPWKWNGNATGFISSLPGNPVGIGLVPAVPSFLLSVAHIGEILAASGGNASIMVGDPSANHLLIDNNEIMVKTNPTNAGVLKLQEEGSGSLGTVEIRGAADAGETTVLTAYGSVDAKGKMKENGNDLLPFGAIIMWNGSAIPAGWALCDGGSYPKMDGTGSVSTPNLTDRFIVGAGNSYTIATIGGENTHTLTTAEMPSHSHTIAIDNAGLHDHTAYIDAGTGGTGISGTSGNMWSDADGSSYQRTDDPAYNGTLPTDKQGEHTHAASIGNTGSGLAFENRPLYFALAYIMKL
jgi:microcystin-dependent protein